MIAVSKGRNEEAAKILARLHAKGDLNDPASIPNATPTF
jgi:hypothetical protein